MPILILNSSHMAKLVFLKFSLILNWIRNEIFHCMLKIVWYHGKLQILIFLRSIILKQGMELFYSKSLMIRNDQEIYLSDQSSFLHNSVKEINWFSPKSLLDISLNYFPFLPFLLYLANSEKGGIFLKMLMMISYEMFRDRHIYMTIIMKDRLFQDMS